MKFGKVLQRAMATSIIPPAQWVDYRNLKKLLHTLPALAPSATAPAAQARLAACPRAAAFFVALLWELRKVSAYFLAAERALGAAYEQCAAELLSVLLAFAPGSHAGGAGGASPPAAPPAASPLREARTRPLLSTLLLLASSLVHLENFAVLCYAGFGKILKKHDKLRGVATRGAFMQAHVNPLPFATCPRLRRMLEGVAAAAAALEGLFPGDGAGLTVGEASRLCFLEDLRGMSRRAPVRVAEEGGGEGGEGGGEGGGGSEGEGQGAGGGGGGGGAPDEGPAEGEEGEAEAGAAPKRARQE